LYAGKEVSDAAGGGETAFAGVAAISASTAAAVPPATKKLRLDNCFWVSASFFGDFYLQAFNDSFLLFFEDS